MDHNFLNNFLNRVPTIQIFFFFFFFNCFSAIEDEDYFFVSTVNDQIQSPGSTAEDEDHVFSFSRVKQPIDIQ